MAQDLTLEQKNKRTALMVGFIVLSMIALAFASVPLYRLFCAVTGYGGTTQRVVENGQEVILERVMEVRFNTNTAKDLPWDFKPEVKKMSVNIGADGFVNFIAMNTSEKPVAGTALFNVTPLKAGKYFNKVQCFCFGEQILNPGEKVNMPVSFFVDPAIAEDRNLDDVKTITLSYSFFKTESEALDKAMEAFENDVEITDTILGTVTDNKQGSKNVE